MKKHELVNLYKDTNGYYKAVIYSVQGYYYETLTFLYYSKKEIFSILRNNHNCKVSHKFY